MLRGFVGIGLFLVIIAGCNNDNREKFDDIKRFNVMAEALNDRIIDVEIVSTLFGLTDVGTDNTFLSDTVRLRLLEETTEGIDLQNRKLVLYIPEVGKYTGFAYLRDYSPKKVLNLEIPTDKELPISDGQKAKLVIGAIGAIRF